MFDPANISDLTGQIILITGGTAGLGRASVVELAKHKPEHIYFTGRNAAKAHSVVEDIKSANPDAKVSFLECDLTSLSSVKKAAETFLESNSRLNVLMCNAGIMAAPAAVSKDGYEIQFATNHIGHAFLIDLLLPTLLHTAEIPNSSPRIISLSSLGYSYAPRVGIVFEDLKTSMDSKCLGPWLRYGQSKIANVLYARQLAKRYPQITSVAIHPGVCDTDIAGNLSLAPKMLLYAMAYLVSMAPAEEGAYNQLWAATAPKDEIVNGRFYEPVAKRTSRDTGETSVLNNERLAEELWDWTQKEIKEHK